jgi:hypothetical protein
MMWSWCGCCAARYPRQVRCVVVWCGVCLISVFTARALSVLTGRTKLLKSAISTMLKQGIVKPSSPLGEREREGGVGKNTLNAILQAVKTACCHGTCVHLV